MIETKQSAFGNMRCHWCGWPTDCWLQCGKHPEGKFWTCGQQSTCGHHLPCCNEDHIQRGDA